MRKIVLVIPSITHGGIEYQMLFLAKKLNETKSYRSFLLGTGGISSSFASICTSENIEFYNLNLSAHLESPIKDKFKAFWIFRKRIASLKPDVMIGTTPWINVLCCFVKLFNSFKLISAIHSILENSPTRLEKILFKIVVPQLTAVSNISASKAALRYKAGKENIKVIYNTVYPRNAVKSKILWREKLCISEDKFICLMVANFFPEKDYETVVEAAYELIEEGLNPHFVFVGRAPGGSTAQKEIKAKIFDLKICHNFSFINESRDIAGLIKSCDLGIFSSKQESFGTTLLEYFYNELPTICTDIPAFHEILGEDIARVSFKVGDTRKLANLIKKAMHDPSWRDWNKYHFQDKLANFFESETFVNNYIEVIE